MIGPRDYVVQTHPCSEAIARANLESLGFQAYLPTVIEELRTGRLKHKRETAMVPLFPRYIFVRFDISNGTWRKIASAKGVQRLLGSDSEHPTPLPQGALLDLRARYAAGEFVRRVETYRISAGDNVTVTHGAFQGHSGICKVSRGDRIRVLLTRLWGAVEVELPSKMVAVRA